MLADLNLKYQKQGYNMAEESKERVEAQQSDVGVKIELKRDEYDGTTLFSNFISCARVGGEIEFEFCYVTITTLANSLVEARAKGLNRIDQTQYAKLIQRIVIPVDTYMQIKPQLEKLYSDINTELQHKKI